MTHDVVGGGERDAELAREVQRPRVEVRLEEHEQPRPGNASRAAAIVGGELGRMVGVVSTTRHAARLAVHARTAGRRP